MILPNKYISISNSFIGESAKIISQLGNKKYSIDKLWAKTSLKYVDMTFEKFIQVLVFMFASNIIQYNPTSGVLYNENL